MLNFYLTIVTNGTVDTVVPSPLHIYLTFKIVSSEI